MSCGHPVGQYSYGDLALSLLSIIITRVSNEVEGQCEEKQEALARLIFPCLRNYASFPVLGKLLRLIVFQRNDCPPLCLIILLLIFCSCAIEQGLA